MVSALRVLQVNRVITVDQQRVKHYRGTPYIRARPDEILPGNCDPDQSARWFAFNEDFTKLLVGGVTTEAQLKFILKGSPDIQDALSRIV